MVLSHNLYFVIVSVTLDQLADMLLIHKTHIQMLFCHCFLRNELYHSIRNYKHTNKRMFWRLLLFHMIYIQHKSQFLIILLSSFIIIPHLLNNQADEINPTLIS